MSDYQTFASGAELAQTREELHRYLEATGRAQAYADGLAGVEFRTPVAKRHAQQILDREIEYRDGRMVAKSDGQTDASVYIRNRICGEDFAHFAKSVPPSGPTQPPPSSLGEWAVQQSTKAPHANVPGYIPGVGLKPKR